MANYENDVVTAIAERLAAAGVAQWSPSGAYASAGGPVIFVGAVPETTRDLITLTSYPVLVSTEPNDSVLGLQVRTRTEGRDVRRTTELDGKVLGVLHGLRGVALSGYRITQILFQSGASMGQDGSERWGRSANYYITGPRHKEETP